MMIVCVANKISCVWKNARRRRQTTRLTIKTVRRGIFTNIGIIINIVIVTKFNINKWERFKINEIMIALSDAQENAWDAHVAAPRRSLLRDEASDRTRVKRLKNVGVAV